MLKWLLAWATNAGVLLLLPYILPAVQVKDFTSALIAALVLGLLNAIVRPILMVLTLPITVITLGLFLLVINGLMFWLASRMLDGFHVSSFGWAIVAAIVYSLITWAVNAVLLRKDA
jgi:putative membrane protein